MVALRRRVEDFLGRLGKAVLTVEGEGEVRVVVAGHGHWMKELSWTVLGKPGSWVTRGWTLTG